MAKRKSTNNNIQCITHKTKDRVKRTPLKTGGENRRVTSVTTLYTVANLCVEIEENYISLSHRIMRVFDVSGHYKTIEFPHFQLNTLKKRSKVRCDGYGF